MAPRFYTGSEDCEWLRETALRGYNAPKFKSFVLEGNEDCPLKIELYMKASPHYLDLPIRIYELRETENNNLSEYVQVT